MITIEQCRAARGLLGWTQQDLAEASGLSKTAINNFEKGHSDIKAESLKAIRLAFESLDIEFIGLEGLRKKSETALFLKGPSTFRDLFDDILLTLENNSLKTLDILDTQNSWVTKLEATDTLTNLQRLKNRNISVRILTGAPVPKHPSYNHTQWSSINEQTALPYAPTTYIYGPKIATEMWNSDNTVILKSATIAQAEKQRFEILWSHSKTDKSPT